MRAQPATGTFLTATEIRRRLQVGEIFHFHSYSDDNIRAAAYELRMARDRLVVPDHRDQSPYAEPKQLKYRVGQLRITEVILNPGDVALVSTYERFCLPWDVAAIIGAKFTLGTRGIQTLTGLSLNPGYGMTKGIDGQWVPREDTRLHFLFANVGPDPVALLPGSENIGSIQFIQVEPVPEQERKEIDVEDWIEQIFFEGDGGLAFFRDMALLRQRVAALEIERADFHRQVARLQAGSNQVLMFGLYLLCVTILGASLATLASVLGGIDEVDNGWGAAAVIAGIAAIGAIYFVFMRMLVETTRYIRHMDDSLLHPPPAVAPAVRPVEQNLPPP